MSDAELRYTFTCPNCTGHFSITLDRVPPVQARFRCPHCKKPMDFPSRDEARVYARLQKQEAAAGGKGPGKPVPEEASTAPPSAAAPDNAPPENARFKVMKAGWEDDVFDRRGLRNLIRTGAVTEHDLLSVNDGEGSPAGELPYLKSLFNLRKSSTAEPPPCCRTHPDKVAFFQCTTSARPLCEDCAPERKFGGTIIRVCQHCGGTANELSSRPA
ncbi:MAG: MJ0042-type zinc finger domain-containing protein [Thermoanaerobaculia bacterium]